MGEWTTIGKFAPGISTWEFLPDGALIDQFDGEIPELLNYSYYPDERLLTTFHFSVEKRYRLEFPNSDHLILYDLQSAEIEPDDYCQSIEMERV